MTINPIDWYSFGRKGRRERSLDMAVGTSCRNQPFEPAVGTARHNRQRSLEIDFRNDLQIRPSKKAVGYSLWTQPSETLSDTAVWHSHWLQPYERAIGKSRTKRSSVMAVRNGYRKWLYKMSVRNGCFRRSLNMAVKNGSEHWQLKTAKGMKKWIANKSWPIMFKLNFPATLSGPEGLANKTDNYQTRNPILREVSGWQPAGMREREREVASCGVIKISHW